MLDLPETSSARMQVEGCERYSRSTNQPDSEYIWKHLSAEQKLAASKSLKDYCEPVELYNRIRSRPKFLERCKDYNIKAKHKKRILMTVSLSWKVDETQPSFPLCICLGRLDPNKEPTGAEKYHVRQIFTFQGPSGIDGNGNNHVRINFMLPQREKLAVEANYNKYFLIILASAENPISLSTINAITLPEEVASNESSGGEKISCGKVSLKFLYEILNISPNSPLQHRTEIQFSTEFCSCNLKYYLQNFTRIKSGTISIQDTNDSQVEGISKILQISTGFEEFGAAREPPPRRTRKRREEASSSSSLPHITWLPGNVSFHYRYYHNKLSKIEVTENFTCAICLVQSTDYKGLKSHLLSSHEIFNFEFSESEEFPSVSVSVKNPNWKQEWLDPKLDTFLYCAKKPKRRKLNTLSHARNYSDELILRVELPIGDAQLLENVGYAPSISDSDNGSHAMQQVGPQEVSNAILHQGSFVSNNQDDEIHTTLEVDHEQVSNVISHPCQGYVPSISDQDGTSGVLEVYQEEVSNVIVLYTGRDRVPPISDQEGTRGVLEVDHEEVSNAVALHSGQDCVPPISDQDGTNGLPELDHEEISNAIVLHTGQDYVPPISDQEGTREVLEVDHEETSNAIVLYTGQDRVSPISHHDNGARAALEDDVSNAIILHRGLDSVPSMAMEDGGTSSKPQVEEKEKSLIELFDPNLIARWKKRTFYHSHTYQAMELEEVVKDEDSEDEINEGARQIEDKRKLELLGISGDQKRLQTMWSSFVKKHRVLADGHMNWAYEAFTKYHCAELAESPSLAWCWRMFMIKLYDQGLLKTTTVCACSTILQQYRSQK